MPADTTSNIFAPGMGLHATEASDMRKVALASAIGNTKNNGGLRP